MQGNICHLRPEKLKNHKEVPCRMPKSKYYKKTINKNLQKVIDTETQQP